MTNCIVFIATSWGTRYGGINSFNYDLCIALAKLKELDLSIICIVNEGTASDIQDAHRLGVALIPSPLQNDPKLDIDAISERLQSRSYEPEWIIGHDVHTEPRASELSKRLEARFAVFHHMDYSAYKSIQVTDDQEYVENQKEILRKAEVVFAIGPKLGISARHKLHAEAKKNVVEILPGLTENMEIENDLPEKFSAITLGRIDPDTDLLKQTSLAIASFATAVNTPGNPLRDDPELTIIGFQGNDNRDYNFAKEVLAKHTDHHIALHLWKFEEERTKLFQHLCNQTVCMILSVHEGFGLVGLEAISAEVPIILSENSGLYLAIKELLGGTGTGCLFSIRIPAPNGREKYNKNSAKQISEILLKVNSPGNDAKRNARSLKQQLEECWTWENTAKNVLSKLTLSLPQNVRSFTVLQPPVEMSALETLISKSQEINERQLTMDGVKSEVLQYDPNIDEALRWLSGSRVLAENIARQVLKTYKDIGQEMQEDSERLDDFHWELQELIGQLHDSLVTRGSVKTKGYKVLDNPSIPQSVNHSDIYVSALEMLKNELPPYMTEEVQKDLEPRIDYLAKKLRSII